MNRGTIKREALLPPLLLTGAEAARLLRISRRTLWKLTAPRGSIRAIQFGRNLRYPPAELQRWVDEQISNLHAGEVAAAGGQH